MYKKRPVENKWGYGMGIALALCASVYIVFNMIDGWDKYRESTRRLEASTTELARFEAQYEQLQKDKAHSSSTTGVEMQIREKFDLAKPDEHIIFITSQEKPEPVPEQKGIKKFISSFKRFFN